MTDWTKAKLNHTQNLLTVADLKRLPAYGSQDGKGEGAICQVHFFYGGYDFWASEFDPQDGIFFGVGRITDREMGDVSATELMSVGRIERDLYWTPKPLAKCGK
jgi:hypothetical protein